MGDPDVTPDSQRERAHVEVDKDVNPLVGAPLPRRLRSFAPTRELRRLGRGPLRNATPPADEHLTDKHLERLAEAYAAAGSTGVGFAERWNFSEVNDLIERHNAGTDRGGLRWIRARATRTVGGRQYRRRPLDAAWVLERFLRRLGRFGRRTTHDHEHDHEHDHATSMITTSRPIRGRPGESAHPPAGTRADRHTRTFTAMKAREVTEFDEFLIQLVERMQN